MNRNIARCLYGVLFAGGLTVLGATAANAADSTTGTDGILSGTVVDAVVSIPVTLNGTAVSVLGDASSTDATTPAPAAPDAPAPTTSGSDSVLGGTNVAPLISIPITLGGNAIGVVGDSTTSNSTADAPAPAPVAAPAASETSGDSSVGGGSNVAPLISVPITVSGNSISVVGDSATEDATASAAEAPAAPAEPAMPAPGAATSGDDGILGGTLVDPAVTLPITIGGNAISVVGDSASNGSATEVTGSAPAAAAAGAGTGTSGDDSVLGGSLVSPDVTLPVTVGGNGISLIGDSSSTGSATEVAGSTPVAPASGTGTGTSGDDSVLGGTVVSPDVTVPVTVGGNGISVIGDSSSNGSATEVAGSTPAAPAAGAGTSGNDGILGGTIISPVIELPVTIGGNAVSVIGDSETPEPTVVVPSTPTTPVVPTDPTTPVTPTDPTTPVTPTDPATPVDPATPAEVATPATAAVSATTKANTSSAMTSAKFADALASSGAGEVGLFLGLSALLLLLGVAVVGIARKRTALQ
ncbi:hypothetical protein ACLRGF_01270 [Mycetocola zhadangensis]|uniref:hypothetical protein n=1 Tax=Mycetocola zhadangensis TaxID=1164595 RepID=UPI003A4D216B